MTKRRKRPIPNSLYEVWIMELRHLKRLNKRVTKGLLALEMEFVKREKERKKTATEDEAAAAREMYEKAAELRKAAEPGARDLDERRPKPV